MSVLYSEKVMELFATMDNTMGKTNNHNCSNHQHHHNSISNNSNMDRHDDRSSRNSNSSGKFNSSSSSIFNHPTSDTDKLSVNIFLIALPPFKRPHFDGKF